MRERNRNGRFQPLRKSKSSSTKATGTGEVADAISHSPPGSKSLTATSTSTPKPVSRSIVAEASAMPSRDKPIPIDISSPTTLTPSISPLVSSTPTRNISHVILGHLRFEAWYPSPYPPLILSSSVEPSPRSTKDYLLPNLFICQWCFGYTPDAREYLAHDGFCELKGKVPGEQIYTHPSIGEAGWSVWEVDGEVDTTFCQNLSLFAKLFLDQKSVFFDVLNFNYYLLVYTSPTATQVVGFFSKEKMSWDNNNLACILIFPPWQRKSLGTLLIAVSYEISRRQRELGGPEKPISELGRKGYLAYWGREIARWILELKETGRRGKGLCVVREIGVGDISKGTWIAVEDVVWALREMGVGVGKGGKVVVDREEVRRWCERVGVGLEPVVDGEGFVEGYGYRDDSDDEESE